MSMVMFLQCTAASAEKYQLMVFLSVSVLTEIGNTISNLFGGGKKEEAGEASSEGSREETVPEVLCVSVTHAVMCRL